MAVLRRGRGWKATSFLLQLALLLLLLGAFVYLSDTAPPDAAAATTSGAAAGAGKRRKMGAGRPRKQAAPAAAGAQAEIDVAKEGAEAGAAGDGDGPDAGGAGAVEAVPSPAEAAAPSPAEAAGTATATPAPAGLVAVPAIPITATSDTAYVTMASGNEAGRMVVALVQSLRDVGTDPKHDVVVLLPRGGVHSPDCFNAAWRKSKGLGPNCVDGGETLPGEIIGEELVTVLTRLGAKLAVVDAIPRTTMTEGIPGGKSSFWCVPRVGRGGR